MIPVPLSNFPRIEAFGETKSLRQVHGAKQRAGGIPLAGPGTLAVPQLEQLFSFIPKGSPSPSAHGLLSALLPPRDKRNAAWGSRVGCLGSGSHLAHGHHPLRSSAGGGLAAGGTHAWAIGCVLCGEFAAAWPAALPKVPAPSPPWRTNPPPPSLSAASRRRHVRGVGFPPAPAGRSQGARFFGRPRAATDCWRGLG